MAWTVLYVRTRATAKSNSLILPNFTCRISLWCRCALSIFFTKSHHSWVISVYSYFSTSTVKLSLKIEGTNGRYSLCRIRFSYLKSHTMNFLSY